MRPSQPVAASEQVEGMNALKVLGYALGLTACFFVTIIVLMVIVLQINHGQAWLAAQTDLTQGMFWFTLIYLLALVSIWIWRVNR